MLTRHRREINEKINEIRLMNRKQALVKLNNIWKHGATSINELKAVMDRIKI